jgi:hypothetical protein
MFLRIDFFGHILRKLQFIDKTGTVYTAIGNGFPTTIEEKKNKFDVQKCQESIVN